MKTWEAIIQADLRRLLPMVEERLFAAFEHGEAPRLAEAMTYSLKAGGKRVRPVLCLLSAESLGERPQIALSGALALEYIHTYSLIHDDLPAMDDDDLRRGKPTCHKVYGEAEAILAGDGLLTEAFCLLAAEGEAPTERRLEAVKILAEAAGWRGMVGGQSLDLAAEHQSHEELGLSGLQRIHRLKTGALLRASVEMGAVLAGADGCQRQVLRAYGEAIGLAFQIQDDILDATSTDEQMGKRVQKDAGKHKLTYPVLLGLDGARKALQEATERALCNLPQLPSPQSLEAWAKYLEARTH